MKKNPRKKNENNSISITKYPYLLTAYNKSYKNRKLKDRNNKSYNSTHNKLKNNTNNTFCLFNPDEEYVTKLNFFNIGVYRRDTKKKITLYNLNTVTKFPSILKKDSDNVESFKEKKRILNELNSKKVIYDKVNNDESSKQTYVHRYENTVKENKLEKERKEIEKKIFKLKEMIKTLSNELSTIIKEIENLKLDVDIMNNYRTYNLFGNVPYKKSDSKIKDKDISNENEKEGPMIKKRKSIIREKDPNEKSKDKDNKFRLEMMLLTKSEKIFKLKEETKAKIKELQEKKSLLLEKIDTCEYELKRFKETHNNIKEELLVHYHRLLMEGKDTRKEGLSWIILAIWNLKSNVMLSYLPKFLDQNIILFLFEYSTLLKTIKETEKKIHELAIKLKEHKENVKKNNNRKHFQSIIFNNNGKIQHVMIDKEKNNKSNDNKERSNSKEENNEESEEKEENEEEEKEEKEEVSLEKEKDKEEENKNDKLINNMLIKEEENENENEENNNSNSNKLNKNNSIDENEENMEEKDEQNEKEIENKEESKGEDNIDGVYNLMKEEKKDNKQLTKFGETFKTSLYNTNSEKTENQNNNNDLFFEKDNFKKSKDNKFLQNKELNGKKEKSNIINMPTNFIKSLFKKENLYKNNQNNEDKEEKVKLRDFTNIYNNKKAYAVDMKTFQLFNEHKNMEKYYLKLKEKAELLMKNELDIVNKSFYLYDYGGKYNIDQKTVISALVGEDSVRAELNKQKKEEKEYFKTLRELRNGKMFKK